MLMPLSLLPSRGRCRGGGSVTLLLPHPGAGQRAAWHGTCLLRPLTATGPSLPVQSPPTTPTSRRARTPWKRPSSRSPSRTRRWPWGRRCCSSASSRPTPSQKVSDPAAQEHDGLWHSHPPACPCPLGPPELGGLGLAELWLCAPQRDAVPTLGASPGRKTKGWGTACQAGMWRAGCGQSVCDPPAWGWAVGREGEGTRHGTASRDKERAKWLWFPPPSSTGGQEDARNQRGASSALTRGLGDVGPRHP